MNTNDKNKLRIIIKMILIQKSPSALTANQLCDFINRYSWGFKSDITSAKIGRFLYSELDSGRKTNNHFTKCIKKIKGVNNVLKYYYEE